jgi:hypothetical protein
MRDPYMRIDFVNFTYTGGLDGELELARKEEGDALE